MGLQPRKPKSMGSQPRTLQHKDISLFESLSMDFVEAMFKIKRSVQSLLMIDLLTPSP